VTQARSADRVHRCFSSSARLGHIGRMAHAPNFKLALTRAVKPTGGPGFEVGVELAALEDAARFVALLRSWRQARPHWDFAAELLLRAAETGKRRDVEAATAQIERALRVEGWL
jgi:hypothetical protein